MFDCAVTTGHTVPVLPVLKISQSEQLLEENRVTFSSCLFTVNTLHASSLTPFHDVTGHDQDTTVVDKYCGSFTPVVDTVYRSVVFLVWVGERRISRPSVY